MSDKLCASEPETVFVKRAELMVWLGGLGISNSAIRKFIDNGVVEKVFIGSAKYAYFRVAQVRDALGLKETRDISRNSKCVKNSN